MSRMFNISYLGGGNISVTWFVPMFNEEAAELLAELVDEVIAGYKTGGEVRFYTANAIIVINTAFDQLKNLCRRLVREGFKNGSGFLVGVSSAPT